jgi:hypothetical protein
MEASVDPVRATREHYRPTMSAQPPVVRRSSYRRVVVGYLQHEVQATDLAYHSQKAKFKDGPSTLTVWNIRRTKFEAPTESASCRPQLEPERHITLG